MIVFGLCMSLMERAGSRCVHIDDQLRRSRNDEISFFIPVYKDRKNVFSEKCCAAHGDSFLSYGLICCFIWRQLRFKLKQDLYIIHVGFLVGLSIPPLP